MNSTGKPVSPTAGFFKTFADLLWAAVSRPVLVLFTAVILTVIAGSFALRLHVDTDFASLLPPEHPNVRAIEKLRETVGGETTAAVIIECPDTEAMHLFARDLIPRIKALRQAGGEPYFSYIDYRRDVDFLERNALYLATASELDTIEEYLLDQIEDARIEVNPMLVDLLDDEDDASPENEEDLERIRDEIIKGEFPVSADGRTMVLKLYVTGSKTNLGFIDRLYAALDAEVAAVDPKNYHPEMAVELGGPLLRHSMELHAIGEDVSSSVGSGMLLVLLMVAAYFFSRALRVRANAVPSLQTILSELIRAPLAVLVIGVPLGMSLSWTFGIAYLRLGALNLITSTLALVLFGLGIDFSIHIYARYTEERGLGHDVDTALERSIRANLQPVTITAVTTAVAFGILSMADFRGFSEFGFISAVGIMLALVSMFTVLPALILALDRSGILRLKPAGPVREPSSPETGAPLFRTAFVASLAVLAVAAFLAPHIRFEWDFDRLEPDFPAYERLQKKQHRVYPPGDRNPAYVVASTSADVPAIVSAVREKAALDTETPTIKRVESLQERFPIEPKLQQAKIARIAEIRRLLDNRYLRRGESDDLDMLRKASQVREPIQLESLPLSLRRSFTSKDGRVGNFIMIYPSVGLSDGKKSMAFADDVGTIVTADGQVYHSASTSIIAAEMLRLMRAESPIMVLLVLASLLVLIPLAFRRLGPSVLALTPLAIGSIWMFAVAVSWKVSLNFYNVVVFPTVLGMGADAGVHFVHRWVEEGRGSAGKVLRSTGEAVAVCSITTMLGFSGMTGSFHPGLRSMGWLAVIGLGSILLASVLFLTALLQIIDNRRGRLERAAPPRSAADRVV